MNDLMMLKGMDSKEGLTPYEQYKVGYMQSKKPSGVAIAGLTVGVVGAVAGEDYSVVQETNMSAQDLRIGVTTLVIEELVGM